MALIDNTLQMPLQSKGILPLCRAFATEKRQSGKQA
jgi:hypothetical protein